MKYSVTHVTELVLEIESLEAFDDIFQSMNDCFIAWAWYII